MVINQQQLKRQQTGLVRWKNNGYKGLLLYPTGTGKTFTAIIGLMHYRKYVNPDAFVIIVVPTTLLKKQWQDKLKQNNIKNVYVEVVNTLVKKDHVCDLFILDEIHSYTGGKVFSTIFDCVSRKAILGLTASKRDKIEDEKVLQEHCPTVDVLPLSEALKLGFISDYVVYNLGLTLSESDLKKYTKINRDFNKYFSTFDHDWDSAMRALRDSNWRENVAQEKGYDINIVNAHAFQFNRTMQERKNFLYNNDTILSTAIAIAEKYPDKKTLVFSKTSDMADRFAKALPLTKACHTNLPTIKVKGRKMAAKRQINMYLEQFKKNKLRRLSTVDMFNAGVDVPDIELTIKMAFNSTSIDAIQRLGRALRKSDKDKAYEINLFLKGTQSEKWLRRSQLKIPNVVEISSIDEINLN